MKLPVNYWISVTAELKVKRLVQLMSSKKTWDYWKRLLLIVRRHAKDKLISPVDPDARMGKKTSKNWPGYKAHIVMEEETGIITGVETTPANATDGSQLKPMLKEQEEVHSIKPQRTHR